MDGWRGFGINGGKGYIVSCQFINNKSIANSSTAGAGAVFFSDVHDSDNHIINRSIFHGNESIGKRVHGVQLSRQREEWMLLTQYFITTQQLL